MYRIVYHFISKYVYINAKYLHAYIHVKNRKILNFVEFSPTLSFTQFVRNYVCALNNLNRIEERGGTIQVCLTPISNLMCRSCFSRIMPQYRFQSARARFPRAISETRERSVRLGYIGGKIFSRYSRGSPSRYFGRTCATALSESGFLAVARELSVGEKYFFFF